MKEILCVVKFTQTRALSEIAGCDHEVRMVFADTDQKVVSNTAVVTPKVQIGNLRDNPHRFSGLCVPGEDAKRAGARFIPQGRLHPFDLSIARNQ